MVGLLEFYILATSKVVSGWIPTCDSVHSCALYSAAPLENEAASTMTQYLTQSHYPETGRTSPCPILLMPNTKLGSEKCQLV